MTAIVYHGPPGSCKTATAVWEWAIPALKKGRKVITNIRGLTLERAKKALKDREKFPDSAEIQTIPLTLEGYETASKFFHWADPGALLIFDEVQKIYPSRQRDTTIYDSCPPRALPEGAEGEVMVTVMDAFDQHRHMNWDIVLTTPNIKKVAPYVREVIESAYRQRPLSGVLPFMGTRMKRVKHNADNSGMALNNALSSSTFKINKKVFDCYLSTATGKVKKSEDKFKWGENPKLLIFIFIMAGAILFLGFSLSGSDDNSKTYADVQSESTKESGSFVRSVGSLSNNDNNNRYNNPGGRFVDYVLSESLYFTGYSREGDHITYFIKGENSSYSSDKLEKFGVAFYQPIDGVLVVSYNEKEYYLTSPPKIEINNNPQPIDVAIF